MQKIIYRTETKAYVVDDVCLPAPDDESVPEEIRAEYAEQYTQAQEYATKYPELVEIEEPPVPLTEEELLIQAKINARSRIDAETSAAIIAGFNYRIDAGTGMLETLHFSYDSFADTANIALLNLSMPTNLSNETTIPTSVVWNAYRNYNSETGGELVRLTLNATEFLALYTNGALTHKSTQMEIGSQKKEKVESATSIEEIKNIFNS